MARNLGGLGVGAHSLTPDSGSLGAEPEEAHTFFGSRSSRSAIVASDGSAAVRSTTSSPSTKPTCCPVPPSNIASFIADPSRSSGRPLPLGNHSPPITAWVPTCGNRGGSPGGGQGPVAGRLDRAALDG